MGAFILGGAMTPLFAMHYNLKEHVTDNSRSTVLSNNNVREGNRRKIKQESTVAKGEILEDGGEIFPDKMESATIYPPSE